MWASSIGSAISGVSPTVAIVEGVEDHRFARQAAAVKAARKTRAAARLGREKKPRNFKAPAGSPARKRSRLTPPSAR